jgi:hypothetical protein
METRDHAVSSTLAVLLLASIGQAGKIVVDASGGPGSHFSDLPPAVLAAQPGDLILVRVGQYSGCALDKGLTILGEGNPFSYPDSARIGALAIAHAPAGPPVVLANLDILEWEVEDVQATVVLEGVYSNQPARIHDSRDVRLHGMLGFVRDLEVIGSRVEVANSTIHGKAGENGQGGNPWWPATDGANGLEIGDYLDPTGRVHLARSSSYGGAGGSLSQAGDGGVGVYVSHQGELVVSGAGSAVIQGGDGGWGDDCPYDGDAGDGLVNAGGQVLRSGVTLAGGVPSECGALGNPHVYLPDANSFDIALSGFDPTLTLLGQPHPAQVLDVELTARDGSQACVFFGTEAVVRPDAATHVELLVSAPRRNIAFLGQVTAANKVVFQLPIPATAQQGDLLFLQGLVVLPSGQYRRTNSVPVLVR